MTPIALIAALSAVSLTTVPASPPPREMPSTSARGPFLVQVPVVGLRPEHAGKVQKALQEAFGRNALEPEVKTGSLTFYFGGEGPKAILRLSRLRAALAGVGLALDPTSWVLEPQEVGLYVDAAEGISTATLTRLIESVSDARCKVAGMLLDGSRLCAIVHLDTGVSYEALAAQLGQHAVAISDLAWGHWEHGFGIELEGASHGHENRAHLRDTR